MDILRWLPWFLALIYIGLPLLTLFSHKIQARPQFVPIDPSDVPPEVTRYFSTVVPELEKEGFHVSASLGMPNLMPNLRTFLVMLINRSAGDKALVTVIYSTNPAAPSTTMYVEFSTRFDSGEMFDTLNVKTLGAFQYAPQETKTRLPSVQDPRLLYQIHRWVMSRKKPAGSKVTYRENEAINYLTRAVIEECEGQVRFGRLKLQSEGAYPSAPLPPVVPGNEKFNSGGAVYRPTVKGAFLMTWGLMWPISWIRKALMKAREQAILRAFRATQGAAMSSFN